MFKDLFAASQRLAGWGECVVVRLDDLERPPVGEDEHVRGLAACNVAAAAAVRAVFVAGARPHRRRVPRGAMRLYPRRKLCTHARARACCESYASILGAVLTQLTGAVVYSESGPPADIVGCHSCTRDMLCVMFAASHTRRRVPIRNLCAVFARCALYCERCLGCRTRRTCSSSSSQWFPWPWTSCAVRSPMCHGRLHTGSHGAVFHLHVNVDIAVRYAGILWKSLCRSCAEVAPVRRACGLARARRQRCARFCRVRRGVVAWCAAFPLVDFCYYRSGENGTVGEPLPLLRGPRSRFG